MFILHKLKSHKRIKSNVPSNLATRIQVTYTMDFCVLLQTVFNQQVQIHKQYSVLIILCNLKIAALIRHHFTGQRSPFFVSLQVLLLSSYTDTCMDLPIYLDQVDVSLTHHSHSYIQLQKKYPVDLQSLCNFWIHKRKICLCGDDFGVRSAHSAGLL